MFAGKTSIVAAFARLGQRLALTERRPVTLVVCGAAALNCTDLVARPTRDVDVVGVLTTGKPSKLLASGIPTTLLPTVEAVAADFGLEPDWLNDRSLILQSQPGLPPGFERRLLRPPLEFGPCLRVTFPGRKDMVALKFYASLDRRLEEAMRHFRDLVELTPTRAEMEFTVAWLLDRPTSVEFRRKVREVAERLGFECLRALKAIATPTRKPRRSKRTKA